MSPLAFAVLLLAVIKQRCIAAGAPFWIGGELPVFASCTEPRCLYRDGSVRIHVPCHPYYPYIVLSIIILFFVHVLRGVFYQGYRCSKCGAGAHKECLGRVDVCVSSAGEPRIQHNKIFLAISVHTHYEAFICRAALEPLAHVSALCDVLPRCTLMIDLHCSVTDRAIKAVNTQRFITTT